VSLIGATSAAALIHARRNRRGEAAPGREGVEFYHPMSISGGAADYGQIAASAARAAIRYYTYDPSLNDQAYAQALRDTYGVRTPILQYVLVNNAAGPSTAVTPAGACGAYSTYGNTLTGVTNYKDFCTALHPLTNDFMRRTDQSRMREVQGTNYLWLLDPASQAWQDLMVDHMNRQYRENSFDGFFLDNCDYRIWRYTGQFTTFGGVAGQSLLNYSPDIPGDSFSTAFVRSMAKLIQSLRRRVNSGMLIFGNITNAVDVADSFDAYTVGGVHGVPRAAGLDGLLDEEWARRTWETPTATQILQLLARVERMTDYGKHYSCISQATDVNDAATNTAKHLFCLCLYLLVMSLDTVTRGGKTYKLTSFRFTNYSDYFVWRSIPQWGDLAALGHPLGPRYQTATNTWRRDFSGGYVTADLSSGFGTFNLA
jgi:hypothetical protein